jgi:hypothetical protein
MCSLYESFTYPFIILFSVPPALVGGVLGVRILHAIEPSVKLDVVTMLGFIIMAGVVANAAILLVEQALHHMREGMHPQDAIIESARNRLRPIFMTASSILGFLPLVASSGAGSELYRGMGAVQLGGMALSTMFTLVLVPTLFSLWMDAKFRLPVLLGKKGVVNLLPADMLNEYKGTRLPGLSWLCGGGKARDVLPGVESFPQLLTVCAIDSSVGPRSQVQSGLPKRPGGSE